MDNLDIKEQVMDKVKCARCDHEVEKIKSEIQIVDPDKVREYANTINPSDLKAHLLELTTPENNGRRVGTEGQKQAVNYIKDQYQELDIPSPIGGSDYFQDIPSEFLGPTFKGSENVVAYIEGSTWPDEVLIVSAHHDHLGLDDQGRVFRGADDNASGTSALLEMAEAFKLAKDNGFGPKRTILFLHLTAEEIGLHGSRYYVENPIFPLRNTIANLNIDMIGRSDKFHTDGKPYIYLIGSDRLSMELHYISEAVNADAYNLTLDYTFNSEHDKNRYYYRSDHFNFAKNNIPVIFYFNGEHKDYHKISDTPDKIEYDLLQLRTQLIFSTAWQLANQEKRITVDR